LENKTAHYFCDNSFTVFNLQYKCDEVYKIKSWSTNTKIIFKKISARYYQDLQYLPTFQIYFLKNDLILRRKNMPPWTLRSGRRPPSIFQKAIRPWAILFENKKHHGSRWAVFLHRLSSSTNMMWYKRRMNDIQILDE